HRPADRGRHADRDVRRFRLPRRGGAGLSCRAGGRRPHDLRYAGAWRRPYYRPPQSPAQPRLRRVGRSRAGTLSGVTMADQTVLDPINDLVEQSRLVLPGCSFGNMPAEVALKEGKGGRIWDEAGREYVDFLLGSGPMFV